MNTRPLISVCINCYNAENTIKATLDSVLGQTYTDLQVIVVDDCSTDGTWDYLQTVTDERVECHRLAQNGHISNANNEALRRVRGEFVAHLDADDTWYPDKLERQLAFLLEHEEYGACFALAEMVDEQGAPTVDDHRFRAENRDQAALLRHFLTVGNYLNHSSMLARRDILDRVGKHDLTLLYFHDFDYWVRMAMICPIYILPDKLLTCRLSAASNSAMTDAKKTVHIYEFARIVYQSVLACPDDLFLEAFADRLRLQGQAHTPEQIELEKAFLLSELFLYLPQNHALGLRRLSELFRDEQYVAVAKRDFGFGVHELYKLEEHTVYHDEIAHKQLADLCTHLENCLNAASSENGYFKERIEQLETERAQVMAHREQLMDANEQLHKHRDELLDANEQLHKHRDELLDANEQLHKHREQLLDANEQLSKHRDELTEQIHALSQHSTAQAEQINALTAQRDELTQKVAYLNNYCDELAEQIAAANTRTAAAENAHNNALMQIDLLNQQIDAMEHTLSWRITKPIRSIRTLMRKLLHK